MVGSLSNLYESIENLNQTYIEPGMSKDAVLKPTVPTVPLFFLTAPSKTFYRCGYCTSGYYSDVYGVNCRSCNRRMVNSMTYVASPNAVGQASSYSSGGGIVKGVVTYMVMDDLVVKPMSTISSLTLLNQFKVKDIAALKEKEVNIGMKEALMLLKASLHSKKVLTDVFIGRN